MAGDLLIMDGSSSIALTLTNSSTLTGGMNPNNLGKATISLDSTSQWTATANSYLDRVTLSSISSIDAGTGVTITAGAVSGVSITSPYTLPSGGRLVLK